MRQENRIELPEGIIRPGMQDWTNEGIPIPVWAPIFNREEFEKHSFFLENRNASFVETGTFYGHGVLSAIAVGCVDIHSIEIKRDLFGYTSCMLDLLAYHNAHNFEIETYKRNDFYSIIFGNRIRISLYLGDSCVLLPKVLQRINVKSTFWLDAHYSGEETGFSKTSGKFPIYKELETIARHNIKNHTIMIDDMATFETNFPGGLSKLKSTLYSINKKYNITKKSKSNDDSVMIAKVDEKD